MFKVQEYQVKQIKINNLRYIICSGNNTCNRAANS